MTDIQDQRDQLETRLARADAVLKLLASANGIDVETLQSVALDASDHVQEARQLCQLLASSQQKGPALSRRPHDHMTVRVFQRPPAAL
ncbi:hypothetical protein [Parasedimentitalea maritima]|uniref:Uncharacterized protein n=1 Tax=Parasedimentitalea maritima TaxID=2578117 RepID=A0A6A4R9I5_9RHOB|nr:hypothetical protein [Zongyanglinia marina]KAE9624480.1 hypothetical protein GP644_23410 [Zongyanglinia marina]